MEQTKLINEKQRQYYLPIGFCIFLVLFAGRFVIKDALPYFSFNEVVFGWN